MTPKDRLEITTAVVNEIGDLIRDQVREDVAAAMQQYRASYIKSDKWCCKNMTQFMTEVFGASKPMAEEGSAYGSTYSLRNNTINYCPFCGVKL